MPAFRISVVNMTLIKRTGNLLLRLLRELADENAYQRYLATRGVSASPEEWRRFCNSKPNVHCEPPKCC